MLSGLDAPDIEIGHWELVTSVIWLPATGHDIGVTRGGLYGAVCTSKT